MPALASSSAFALPLPAIKGKLALLAFKYLFLGLAMLALCGWWPMPVSAWLALALFAAFLAELSGAAPAAFLMLLPFSILRITELISGIVIEHGALMMETDRVGGPTGAFLRLTLVYILFYAIAAAVIEFLKKRYLSPTQQQAFLNGTARLPLPAVFIMNATIAFGIFYVLMIGWRDGFPLLQGFDRFQFKQQADAGFTTFLHSRVLIALYLGLMHAQRRGWFYALFFAVVIGVSALFGEKFTSIVGLIALFNIPWLLKRRLNLTRLLPIGLLMAAITLPLIFTVYGGWDDPQFATQLY
ncbi:MAG TPA: hypothetical protein VHB73_01320, partial [Alphaproteobacteria bacterium]|nr:hypothetical protein [Alphaproteobacteria bacterium]